MNINPYFLYFIEKLIHYFMKSKYIIILLLLVANLSLTGQNNIFQSDKLKKIWELSDLDVPECVLPVPEKEILYVSNIGSMSSDKKENNGFISLLGIDGSIIDLKWITGLNSPKGMALYGNYLFVTEVDRVSKIDIQSGEKVKSYPVAGAVFLNDIAVDRSGILYITDSRTGTIHRLHNDTITVLLKSDAFPSPNGIITVEERILVGTGKKVISIDSKTLEVRDCLLNTGSVDGLAMIEPDVFLFSDWPGRIHIMRKEGEKELLLDTTGSQTLKTADFGYNPNVDRLYVPTFFGNSVVCYELNY